MQLYIAHDNTEFCRFVRRVAEAEGWRTITCSNGRELALVVAAEDGPALLIVDINMPELDGIEVIEDLKKVKRRLRVRFVTGGEMINALAARMISEAHGMQAGSFILKPIVV